MKIGFIGLGVMGNPMARHLIKGGHEVSVWARRQASADEAVAAGAVFRATPAELAQHCEVVFTIITASSDVEQVALGDNGLIHGFARGSVHVDMSTIAPTMARKIAGHLAIRGIDFLDAPVSGGGMGAQNATLAIMAGGKPEVFARIKPLFELMGKTILHVGPTGAGQITKACNQMVMVAAIQAVAEAAHLAAANNVDFSRVVGAMQSGSAGSRVLDFFGDKMARRDFAAGIEARLHHKDYALIMEEAARAGAPLPISAQVWQQLNGLMALGWGKEDTSSLLRVMERYNK
ncbi:MAG: NAD(P)-dependent oxidoreductase [Rhodocyclaceae bacterium]|jgi:2-hydroxy-3-oxopropionate reductase|nr:NAD(P)-dependent oxidoreductase [Rhodocyclaceae bacterium]